MIYSVLISGAEQNDSHIYIYTHIFFFIFFSIMADYRLLNIVP